MHTRSWAAVFAAMLTLLAQAAAANTRWGVDYFPNIELTTHDGERLRFYDDLIKDKVVVINFIYTTCPDVCPMETAQLTRVQRILGDRVGKDVFFYSITIDPETDTPAVLSEYRDRFGARWKFLTGDKQDIVELRRKLGLYIEDIEGGENNHNVNMIIGNQKTGRWMKRSPFENSYVLADQIGNWLHGWTAPQHVKDYANAPQLRNISDGEKLFRTRCMSCHTIDGSGDAAIGPDLLGVTERRDRTWLASWLRAPDKMLADKDPIAMELYERFNRIPMPNLSLGKVDVMDLLTYMEERTAEAAGDNDAARAAAGGQEPAGDVLAVMNAWVREALPGSKVNAGYLTLVNVGDNDARLESVQSDAYGSVEVHTMRTVDGLMEMEEVEGLVVPARDKVYLRPGEMHLMMFEPQRELTQGDRITLTLNFETGQSQDVTMAVKNR